MASIFPTLANTDNEQASPAAMLWPDKERQWEPLLPALRERLPLLTLGPYAPQEPPARPLECAA